MSGQHEAVWDISLDIQCPECHQMVNLLDIPDSREALDIEIGEMRRDQPVWCPECGAEFICDITR